MREYGVANNKTNEWTVIYGRTVEHALARHGMDSGEWTVLWVEYVD